MPSNLPASSLLSSVVASATAAMSLIVATHLAATGPTITAVVSNTYDCSRSSQQCWQTNPPHSAAAINRCTWSHEVVLTAQPAHNTCDKYTRR